MRKIAVFLISANRLTECIKTGYICRAVRRRIFPVMPGQRTNSPAGSWLPTDVMFGRLFSQFLRVSYGITVCNEAVELERLIHFLLQHKDPRDEVLVLRDTTHEDEGVCRVIDKYRSKLIVREAKLSQDFAAFKNNLLPMASGDYLFQLDADELPGEILMRKLKRVLAKQSESDCFAVPRVNRVEGITPEQINRWKWQIDEQGRINFPDFQLRIFRLNQAIRWKNKVHEELTGFQRCHYLPATNEDFCLTHVKNIDRQQQQNDFYESLD